MKPKSIIFGRPDTARWELDQLKQERYKGFRRGFAIGYFIAIIICLIFLWIIL